MRMCVMVKWREYEKEEGCHSYERGSGGGGKTYPGSQTLMKWEGHQSVWERREKVPPR